MSVTRQMRRHQERLARKCRLVTKSPPDAERLASVAFIYEGETHHGFRSHAELRQSIGDPSPYKTVRHYVDGFWTSRGRFVSREAAATIGKMSGQVSPRFGGRELLSSDVNW
jgi:hypothetical protein